MIRHYSRDSLRNRRPNRSAGNNRPGFHRKGSFRGDHIDISKLIHKAVITEEVESFVPEHSFTSFLISEHLKANVLSKGYTTPTPIQDKAIPHILRGADVVGVANTGTGKTAAFLIPLIHKLHSDPTQKLIVMVPTRELGLQIDQEFRSFSKNMQIASVCCIGGANISRQLAELRRGHHVVIGTPGRIKDLVKRRAINLAGFRSIVLDEADRMLDMGFIADMRLIVSALPVERQTLFFSATVSREIDRLIKEFLRTPVTISVKTGDTAETVDQDIIQLKVGETKIDVLNELLKKSDFNKVLIFGRTKHGVEKLSQILAQRGFKVESIHGDKDRGRRQKALKSFRDDQVQVLVATDVAARGLDISNISHVINFDMPATYEDYVHRVGRTGRGNKPGKALTFVE